MAHQTEQHLRLSTSELENALREEKKKWRIFRLQQVREQARLEAGRVRGAVRRRKAQMVHSLGQELLQKWQDDKENQVQQLQQEYDGCFRSIGKAHDQAKEQPDAVEMLAQDMAINRQKAARRGCEAIKTQKEHNVQKERDKNKPNQLRKSAIKKEKLRANRVAQLPTPEAFKKKRIIVPEPVPTVQLYEHGTLTTTSYVPKNVVIEKEIKSTKPSAHRLAEVEEITLVSVKETERIEAEECKRKREKRGNAALRKERLHRMYRNMVDQLDRAHHDHQLSAFIRGADLSLYEIEKNRLRGLVQHDMEVAVEKVLEGKESIATEEDLPEVIGVTEEASDLKEVLDDSRLETIPETCADQGKGLHELQEEMKRHRHLIFKEIDDLQGSSSEKEPECVDIDDTLKPELSKDSETISQVESRANQNQPDMHVESSDQEPINREEIELSRRVGPQIVPAKDIRGQGQKDDIHFAETVPVHLMPETRNYREMSIQSNPSCQSSSERTVQPVSSDDIEVRIHFSSDSSISSSQVPAPPDRYVRPTVPVHTDRPYRRYPEELVCSGGDSTEYLSLPSSFSCARDNATYFDNLEKIRERRQNVQRLLDARSYTRNQEVLSPMTYIQEMSRDGSGRKPLTKKEKFELKKKEILHYYMRRLVNLKDEELMQISASTVEGSGLTVSSLCTLLESLNKDGDDSVFSPFANLTESSSEIVSSAMYPDIDKVPTKLSSSSELIVNPNILANIPRVCSDYDPKLYFNGDQNADSSSSLNTDLRTNLVCPHSHIYEPESSSEIALPYVPVCQSSRIPDFHSNLKDPSKPSSERLVPLEKSSTLTSSVSELKCDEADLQRELKILQDLRALQRLKQELLLKKNDLMKENEQIESVPHHGYVAEATDVIATQETGNTRQSMGLNTNFDSKSKEQTPRHIPDSGNWRTPSSRVEQDTDQRKAMSAVSHVTSVLSPRIQRNMNEERDSDMTEDRFLPLQPEASYRSIYSSDSTLGKDESRKPLTYQSFTGTKFRGLFPIATLQSERISSDFQRPSYLTGTTASSQIPDRTGDSKSTSISVTRHRDSYFQKKLQLDTPERRAYQYLPRQMGSREQGQMADENRFVHPNLDETLTSIRERNSSSGTHPNETLTSVPERNLSSGTNPDDTLTSRREENIPSYDMPKDCSRDQTSKSNQYDNSEENLNKSSSVSDKLPKSSSSDSITSIPDMAEILQRFGLNWAKSMIRKMDKAEETSSSGN